MKHTFYIESVLAGVLALLLILLVKPLHIIVDMELYTAVIVLAVLIHITKVFIIWREPEEDERDLKHRFHSSWISYVSVSAILMLGIVVQGSAHGKVDFWLPLSLAALFVSKLASRIYFEIKE